MIQMRWLKVYEKDDAKSKVVGIGVDGSYVKILKKGKEILSD